MKTIAFNSTKQIAVPMACVALLVSGQVFANATGGEFVQELYDFMRNSMSGMVGNSIAIGGLAYGLIAGIARGSIAGLGTGVGLAVAGKYGPTIITAMMGASL